MNSDIQTVKTVFDHFESLRTTSSNNERKDLLETLITSSDITRKTIFFLIDKFEPTHIAKAKLQKEIATEVEPAVDIENFNEYVDYLSTKVNGTDASVKSVQNYASKFDATLKPFIFDLASKSSKIHINASTYNKVAKANNLTPIPDFKVQLAESIDKVQSKLTKDAKSLGKFTITEKFDGIRCIAFVKDNKVQLFARSGQEFQDVPEISSELLDVIGDGEHVFDGELLISQSDGKAEDAFRETNSITSSKGTKTGLTYHIFDELTSVERYLEKNATRVYKVRRDTLEALSDALNAKPHLQVAEVLYHGDDVEKAFDIRDEIVARGGEGAMLNLDTSIYQFKRTKELLKLKQIYENDGIIKSVYEGDGENKGRLGGIQITYKDTVVNVGSGFSKQERIDYWQNPDLIIGKIGTYKYTTESVIKTVDAKNPDKEIETTDLRFARWKGLRPDKTAKDVSYDN